MDILIADDDAITRSLLRRMLEAVGHRVLEAGDGRQAWHLLQKTNTRLVITDWMMPEMDGLELCRGIRSRQDADYVFIIILTTNDERDDIIQGLEAGADDYLCKPFHQAELIARINTGLRILRLESSLKKAYEEIRLLSVVDTLTGCFNRRYLDEHLNQEIQRATRYRLPLSIAMVDIDFFKGINDRYGHLVGDQVLAGVGSHLRLAVRNQVDWVCRYGGEEFVVVLPETDSRGAHSVAERLRRGIAGLSFSSDQEPVNVTASFGVVGGVFRAQTGRLGAEKMLRQADAFLYQAKASGRDCVRGGGLKMGAV